MKQVEVRGENADFGPPRGWDQDKDGTCGRLSVRREPYRNGNVELTSAWRPSPSELARLNAGCVVELGCIGIQPPVRLSVSLPGEYSTDGV